MLQSLELERLVSSPFRRCLDTVRPFAAQSGLELEVRSDLRECLVAPTLIDGFRGVWERSWRDFDFALDGCETQRSAQRRMVGAVAAVCAEFDATRIGISSHGNVIGLLLNHLDPAFGRPETESLRNPEIVRLRWIRGELHIDREYRCADLAEFASSHEETPVRR